MKTVLITAFAVALSLPGLAQAAGPTKAELDRSFGALDANKDGRIDRAEYDAFMQARAARETAEYEAAIQEMDQNKDGKVSRQEAAVVPLIASVFDGLDTNKDGSLSHQELREALEKSQAAKTPAP